jgi:hypothetical protein
MVFSIRFSNAARQTDLMEGEMLSAPRRKSEDPAKLMIRAYGPSSPSTSSSSLKSPKICGITEKLFGMQTSIDAYHPAAPLDCGSHSSFRDESYYSCLGRRRGHEYVRYGRVLLERLPPLLSKFAVLGPTALYLQRLEQLRCRRRLAFCHNHDVRNHMV